MSNRLNPLDPGPRVAGMSEKRGRKRSDQRRVALLVSFAESALGRGLLAGRAHRVRGCPCPPQSRGRTGPDLAAVVGELLDPAGDGPGSTVAQLRIDGREVGHALGRLVQATWPGCSTGLPRSASTRPCRWCRWTCRASQVRMQLIALVMTCASAWMEAALAEPGRRAALGDLRRGVAADRAPALLARMQSQWKLSRALGIANLMVIHRLSDLDAVGDANSGARNLALGLLADCSTRIIYAQEQGEAEKTGRGYRIYRETEIAQLPDLHRGEGLWRIGESAFVVRHDCTPGELELFDTNGRMEINPRGFRGSGAKNVGTEG